MLTIENSTLFYMPKDRELLFPALAAVQTYIKDYKTRMLGQDGSPHIQEKEYVLRYSLDIDEAELAFFKQAGLELPFTSEITYPDAVVDLRESRLEKFMGRGKRHVSDVYAIMSGCAPAVKPAIRQVKPRKDMTQWVSLNRPWFGKTVIHVESLLTAKDSQFSGVIGYQSWETYLAASMGLPVIEILQKGRSRHALSKWFCHYRLLIEEDGDLLQQFQQAFSNLEDRMKEEKAA